MGNRKIQQLQMKDSLKKQFNDILIEFILDEKGNTWITAEQLGIALGYADPLDKINKILKNQSMILRPSKVTARLCVPGNDNHDVIVVNEIGVYMVCMKVDTSKARSFCKWLANIKVEPPVLNSLEHKSIQTKEIIQKQFHDITVDFRQDEYDQIWITADQLGTALGYAEPRKGIMKIIERHSELLSEFTGVVNLTTPGHGHQIATIINEHGADIICMKANTPKAKEYIKWAAKIISDYRHGRLTYTVQNIDAAFIQKLESTMGKLYTMRFLRKHLKIKDSPVVLVDETLKLLNLDKDTIAQAFGYAHADQFYGALHTGNFTQKYFLAQMLMLELDEL